MKIRSNFVANSSSSSSVFITTETEHNRVLGLLTEFEKAVVEKYVKEKKLGNIKLYCLEECGNDLDWGTFVEEKLDSLKYLVTDRDVINWNKKDGCIISDLMDKYRSLIDKNNKLYFFENW